MARFSRGRKYRTKHTYDYGLRWVRKTLDSDADSTIEESRVFVHDNGQIVLDFEKGGTSAAGNSDLAHGYLWGSSIDQLLADETADDGSEGDTAWTLTDHLNSVRDLVVYDPITQTVSVVKHVTYDAFGNATSDSAPAILMLFRYTARPFDVDAGIQNNGFRWYDVSTGRWMSEDSIRVVDGDRNLYRYVRNQPQLFLDPAGPLEKLPNEDVIERRLRQQATYKVILHSYLKWKYVGEIVDELVGELGDTQHGRVNVGAHTFQVGVRFDSVTCRSHIYIETLDIDLTFKLARYVTENGVQRQVTPAEINRTLLHEAKHFRVFVQPLDWLRADIRGFEDWFQGHYQDPLSQDDSWDAWWRASWAAGTLQVKLGDWLDRHMKLQLHRQILHLDHLDEGNYRQILQGFVGMPQQYVDLLLGVKDVHVYDSVEETVKLYLAAVNESRQERTRIIRDVQNWLFDMWSPWA